MQKSEESNISESPKCPRCHNEDARVHPLYGILLGAKCRQNDANLRKVGQAPEFYAQTMQTRINQQRDDHEADFMPPYDHNGKPNEEFRRAFPEKAKELFKDFERITGQETELSQ